MGPKLRFLKLWVEIPNENPRSRHLVLVRLNPIYKTYEISHKQPQDDQVALFSACTYTAHIDIYIVYSNSSPVHLLSTFPSMA